MNYTEPLENPETQNQPPHSSFSPNPPYKESYRQA